LHSTVIVEAVLLDPRNKKKLVIASATIINPQKNLAYQLQWNKSQMKNVMEWKSPIKGDYVWAVEPTNATFDGIKVMREQKLVETMKPFETRCFDLDICIIENYK